MRYREGETPDPSIPHGESMHGMLTLSMFMSIAIGIALLLLGLRGNVMWLKAWSIGLIFFSVLYLLLEAAGYHW